MNSVIENNLLIVKSFHQDIYRDLVQYWGEKDFSHYIDNLLEQDKQNQRLRFSLSVLSLDVVDALIKLKHEHRIQFN